MASISTNKSNGTRSIQFLDPKTGKRRILALGKMPLKQADAINTKIEALITCNTAGTSPSPELAVWIANLDVRIAKLLAKWGLIAERKIDIPEPLPAAPEESLIDFIDAYIKTRTDTTERTRKNYKQARDFLEKFIAKELKEFKTVKTFTKADAKRFANWLASQISQGGTDPHSDNYVRTQCKNLKLFFGAAVDGRLIADNPFKDDAIPCKVQAVPERMVFINADDTAKLLEACSDIEWKLVVALARWGGFRIPSEITGFKWDHIDWKNNRLTVLQPKLKRKGKGQRICPLFHQLLPILREARELADADAVYVLPRLRGESKNLRTTMYKTMERAGLTPWGKPFQNLRSSRATELSAQFGLKATSDWLGHDVKVSLEHYQQVRPEDWNAATVAPENMASTAMQNPMQTTPETVRNDSKNDIVKAKQVPEKASETCLLPHIAISCDSLQECTLPPRGFEPLFSP